ncbi:MAG: HAD family phosphatase [Kiritimatiellaeota bacterium]|nr:HAD family phosphatase [Kiritimatiellota bacterium]
MNRIRLVATDLDGTLLSDADVAEDFFRFRLLLQKLRGGCGTRWAIITGRSVRSMGTVLTRLLVDGLTPDYFVTEDAKIFRRRSGGGFFPFVWWNFTVDRRRATWRRRFRKRLADWTARLRERFPDAEELAPEAVDLWFRFGSEEDARSAEEFLRGVSRSPDSALIFRWGREMYAAPAAGTKGEAVLRLLRDLGADPAEAFAVGDGPNDASMLDGRAAGFPACVANASERIKATVRQAGGYVAAAPGVEGVVEALAVCTGLDAGRGIAPGEHHA